MAWYIKGQIMVPRNRATPIFDWSRADFPKSHNPMDWNHGKRVDPTTVPRTAVLTSGHKTLQDFIVIRGIWAVVAAFREIVGRLEPNLHQFFPVTMVDKADHAIGKQYFLMNICHAIDAEIIEKSDLVWFTFPPGRLPDGTIVEYQPHLVASRSSPHLTLSKSKIAGAHLWVGDKVLPLNKYFSNELMTAVTKAGLKQLDAIQTSEE